MSQMIVLSQGRGEREREQPAPERPPGVAAPATLFEVIDQAASAVIAQLDRWAARDAAEGADEAHFEEYVRWRVAIVEDAARQALALMAGDDLAAQGSLWLAAQARA